ncbi:MAG: dipicolinate synthase subunit B, partial [Christensenellales bacterium]
PIVSGAVAQTDTRFGKAADFISRITAITGRAPITTIADAEPIGPQRLLDILVVAPCTGNTLAKLANGITDTSVTMACKAQLRNLSPLLIALSTNDGLSANAPNLGAMLNRRHVYFVPFGQDDPQKKVHSLTADLEKLPEALHAALEGNQLQPLLSPAFAR